MTISEAIHLREMYLHVEVHWLRNIRLASSNGEKDPMGLIISMF